MKRLSLHFIMLAIVLRLCFETQATVTLIDDLGVYPLGGGIIADPFIDDDTIVTITASNVILDIGGYVLTQLSTNTQNGLTGVLVYPNLTNITIRNGAIENISGYGIYINDGCSQIYLENLLLANCNYGGIILAGNTTGTGINNVFIDHCLINDCIPTDSSNAYGIRLIATSNISIKHSTMNGNQTALGQLGYGMSFESCSACTLNKCKAYNNGGTLFGTGIGISQSNGCSLFNCIAGNNLVTSLSATGTASGFSIDSSSILLLSHCLGNHNVNNAGIALGFYSQNNNSLFFDNCIGGANIGGTLAAGFCSTGTDTLIGLRGNTFNINTALLVTGSSYGILLNGAQKSTIRNNTTSNNMGVRGYGLVDTTLNTNNIILSNLSFNNTTTGYVVTFTSGELPVRFIPNNDFSNLLDNSEYYNISIIPH